MKIRHAQRLEIAICDVEAATLDLLDDLATADDTAVAEATEAAAIAINDSLANLREAIEAAAEPTKKRPSSGELNR